jgi:hypothetical protein
MHFAPQITSEAKDMMLREGVSIKIRPTRSLRRTETPQEEKYCPAAHQVIKICKITGRSIAATPRVAPVVPGFCPVTDQALNGMQPHKGRMKRPYRRR